MKATMLDMRRNPRKIIDAIKRNEKVTLSVRGREIAEIIPRKNGGDNASIADDPAVGMWADRGEMSDPEKYVRELRKGRFDVV
jgi:antitoxin (DNA-binding transcriptional repressor) of toxin-antitoxin stability system